MNVVASSCSCRLIDHRHVITTWPEKSEAEPQRSEMKNPFKILCIGFGVLALVFACPVYRLFDFRNYYGEAEPLVEVVWPLALESSEFEDRYGRRPYNLNEIDSFSKEYSFTALEKFNPEFHKDGKVYFRMRVNKRYSFTIDQAYCPKWEIEK